MKDNELDDIVQDMRDKFNVLSGLLSPSLDDNIKSIETYQVFRILYQNFNRLKKYNDSLKNKV